MVVHVVVMMERTATAVPLGGLKVQDFRGIDAVSVMVLRLVVRMRSVVRVVCEWLTPPRPGLSGMRQALLLRRRNGEFPRCFGNVVVRDKVFADVLVRIVVVSPSPFVDVTGFREVQQSDHGRVRSERRSFSRC